MKLRFFPLLVLSLFLSVMEAQTNGDAVLFTIDNEPVYTSEFIRVYNKNIDLVQDESQKDVDEYLTLFTNYKLKLKEAHNLGLQNKESYIRELDSYKKQLSKNFMTDSKVTDALIEEAYERVSNEVKASHILVRFAENASPEDTLVAYNNIVKLRERTLVEGFENVMKEVHNGQTLFGEELGYFSGFRMVYPFENAAFNTKAGEISQPFRTRFGYHIVKIYDIRKSRGERTIAHIMVNTKPGDTLAEIAETRINDIYKKLQQGEDFEALAKQFSDDKSSANKGGMLAPFSAGQLSSQEFEDVAFGLEKIGDVSKPVKTQYGWHILKLYDKQPVKPFSDLKPELEMKVKRDERSHLIDDALVSKLKIKYNVSTNQKALDYFASILNDDYFKRTWNLPENFKGNLDFIKVGNQTFTYQDFGDYLVKNQRSIQAKAPFSQITSKQYEAFLSSNLTQYQEAHLEEENKDYANIVQEYRDGLLLFDLMETTIWNAARTDSIAIQDFYNAHKEHYMWPDRVHAVVASSSNESILKKVGKLLEKDMDPEEIKKLFNKNNEVNIIFTTGLMDAQDQALPENFEFKKGLSKIYKHSNGFVIVMVKDVYPSSQKTLDEAKGNVVGDFQTFKENTWIEELKSKYKVNVNPEALKQVKSAIKNQ
ncbi:peptidylprolyl isomerase [Gaetbulibacter aquiaggeris]|uniref:Peptidylprolyl isomerase n=1 Tax=Gaetbulibacter aquiaggeris TaxID=1735373 RepID=A0ABW7MSN9_9FLAO